MTSIMAPPMKQPFGWLFSSPKGSPPLYDRGRSRSRSPRSSVKNRRWRVIGVRPHGADRFEAAPVGVDPPRKKQHPKVRKSSFNVIQLEEGTAYIVYVKNFII